MAQDLKMFELLNKNGVTEVKVGRGRIEPRLGFAAAAERSRRARSSSTRIVSSAPLVK